jgi:hypothetical protein
MLLFDNHTTSQKGSHTSPGSAWHPSIHAGTRKGKVLGVPFAEGSAAVCSMLFGHHHAARRRPVSRCEDTPMGKKVFDDSQGDQLRYTAYCRCEDGVMEHETSDDAISLPINLNELTMIVTGKWRPSFAPSGAWTDGYIPVPLKRLT